MTEEKPRRRISSYGRNRGRKLGVARGRLEKELLPKISLIVPVNAETQSHTPKTNNVAEWIPAFAGMTDIALEIGFGSGEHLAMQAEKYPDVGFIGCEPYITSATKLLVDIEEKNLKNIRLYNGDARDVMAALPDDSLSKAFVLFPDPWPKARHQKRRLINHDFLNEMHRILKPEATLLLATDHEDYLTWMLEHILARTDFEWTAGCKADWANPPADWVTTKYQAKALREGRVPHWLRLQCK